MHHPTTTTTERPVTMTTTGPKNILLSSVTTGRDDLPASPELQVDLSGETFNTDLFLFDDDDDIYSQTQNTFTQLELETKQATDTLDKITQNSSLYSESLLPLTVSFCYDENHNLIVLTADNQTTDTSTNQTQDIQTTELAVDTLTTDITENRHYRQPTRQTTRHRTH